MHVEIRNIVDGEDNLAGVLRLQGGHVVAEPPDNSLLLGILDHPVADQETRQLYRAEIAPEEFLRTLHQQYRSAYLRASEAIEDSREQHP